MKGGDRKSMNTEWCPVCRMEFKELPSMLAHMGEEHGGSDG